MKGDAGAGAPPLGVGLLYNVALPEFLAESPEAVDYLEVIPDTFWSDRGAAASPRFEEIPRAVADLGRLGQRFPLVGHSIGFSLGSAGPLDPAHLEQLARWQRRYGFPWHSDHLSFARLSSHDGHEHNAGLAVPVPYDRDLLDLIVSKVEAIQARIDAPFMIENNVYFIDLPEQEMSEPEFLNGLCARTGCGLLLDLHNVYANARNHGFDAEGFVSALHLERVREIHIAGGSEFAGMYTDSHAGPCPEAVWQLLEATVPRAPALAGITFEFHESYYPMLGADGVRRELERAREIFALRTG
jgi:uncharacterized protein (UPF0276 family)